MKLPIRRSLYYLASAGLGAAIPVLVLPLVTRELDAADYGLFALASALSALVSAVIAAVSGFVLPAKFPVLDEAGRRGLVSTILCLQAMLCIPLVVLGLPLAGHFLPFFVPGAETMFPGFALMLAAGCLGGAGGVATEILSVEGRATVAALSASAQAMINGAIQVWLVLGVGLGALSLYVAQFTTAAVGFVFALLILRRYLGRPDFSRWLIILASQSRARFSAGIFEQGVSLFERWWLGSFVGMQLLGIYAHATQYRAMAMMLLNASSLALWPEHLADARAPGSDCRVIRRSWLPVQIGVALLGLAMALVGSEMIAWLTHDKFTAAAPFATVIIAALLLQSTGKPESVWLIANAFGHQQANQVSKSIVIRILTLLVAVPLIGVYGALCATLIQVAALRWFIHRAAKRHIQLRSSDGVAYAATSGLLAIVTIQILMELI